MAVAWHVDELPDAPGRDTTAILAAAADGELEAVLVAGVELADLPDPELAQQSLGAAKFVVSMEVRRSAVTDPRTWCSRWHPSSRRPAVS